MQVRSWLWAVNPTRLAQKLKHETEAIPTNKSNTDFQKWSRFVKKWQWSRWGGKKRGWRENYEESMERNTQEKWARLQGWTSDRPDLEMQGVMKDRRSRCYPHPLSPPPLKTPLRKGRHWESQLDSTIGREACVLMSEIGRVTRDTVIWQISQVPLLLSFHTQPETIRSSQGGSRLMCGKIWGAD